MPIVNSPNMSLPIPVSGKEPGPQFALDVNSSLNIIDGHNHASGSGVQITPSGLNINADLPLNQNNLTLINSLRFVSLLTPIPNSGLNVGCLYVSGNELYYNDVTGGHQVKITTTGSVNSGAGSIGGLPSGTASANYTASTFVFQAATNTAATIDGASFILRNSTANSHGVTLSPPNALGSDYSLILPTIPAQTNVMTLDASGNMGSITYNAVGQNMTSVGANAIASSMTATGADAIASSMNATGANAIAATMNITGVDSIIATSNNANFPGKAVQESGLNVVVSNTNVTNSLAILQGGVTSGGAPALGVGFTSVENSTGAYTVSFITPFADTPAIMVQPNLTGTTLIGSVVTAASASGFQYNTFNTNTGTLTSFATFFIAIAQRS